MVKGGERVDKAIGVELSYTNCLSILLSFFCFFNFFLVLDAINNLSTFGF